MKRKLLALLLALTALCAAVLPAGALGNDQLVPMSSTQRMTKSQCWQWTYEALGYVYHEILARHGFIFDPNGTYAWYFTNQAWYHAIASRNNQDVYNSLSRLEWDNINLIKQVRQDMINTNNKNPGGKPAPSRNSYYSTGYSEPYLYDNSFREVQMSGNVRMAVYSAPSTSSWRGANGKAMCTSMNGSRSGVYVAGRDGSWVLIAYYLNHGANQGGWRVGYVRQSEMSGLRDSVQQLSFLYQYVTINSSCWITDDPLGYEEPITRLNAGTGVTLLLRYRNGQGKEYAYIETTYYGQTLRGFVPLSCVSGY